MSTVAISPGSIEIDDVHPFVFSLGDWQELSIAGLFNNTVSYSSTAGDRKVVRFFGTSILVQGGLQQYSGANLTNAPPLSSYSIDNGPSTTFSAPSPPFYTAVTYYKSSELPMGEHVLTIKNTVSNDIIHVDAFVIQAKNGGTPQILQSDGSPVPSPASPALSNTSSGETPTVSPSLLTQSGVGPVVSISSFPVTLVVTTIKSPSQSMAMSTQSSITGPQIFSVLPPSPTPTSSNTFSKSSANHTPIIAAAVLGVLVSIFLAVSAAVLLRRRYRHRQQAIRGLTLSDTSPFHSHDRSPPNTPDDEYSTREMGRTPSMRSRSTTPDLLPSDLYLKTGVDDVGYSAYHKRRTTMNSDSTIGGKTLVCVL